jgi:hypothetical protein
MKRIWTIVFAVFSGPIAADVPPAQKPEVEYLLNFVQQSGCTIDRNGKSYPASEALSHIQKKYAYFRGDIESTEDFIELSATKSTLSGKYYTVSCDDGEQIRTRKWLLQELRSFREQEAT